MSVGAIPNVFQELLADLLCAVLARVLARVCLASCASAVVSCVGNKSVCGLPANSACAAANACASSASCLCWSTWGAAGWSPDTTIRLHRYSSIKPFAFLLLLQQPIIVVFFGYRFALGICNVNSAPSRYW